MKLGTLLLRAVLLLMVALGVAQWWVMKQAEIGAQRFLYQWRAYGDVHYDRLWVTLWGTAWLKGLSIQPNGLTQATLGTPLGYRITVADVHIDQLELAADGSVLHARLRLQDLQLPMDDGYRLRGRDVPPALAQLGYQNLKLQAGFDIRSIPDAGLLLISGDFDGADSARLDFKLQLDATQGQLAQAPDQIGLRKLQLDYLDRGLMGRYLDRRASDLQIDRGGASDAVISLLDRRVQREHWRWEESSASALRSFIRDPHAFRAILDPPGDVILRNLNLYAVGDWPALLGFRFQALPKTAPDPAS